MYSVSFENENQNESLSSSTNWQYPFFEHNFWYIIRKFVLFGTQLFLHIINTKREIIQKHTL